MQCNFVSPCQKNCDYRYVADVETLLKHTGKQQREVDLNIGVKRGNDNSNLYAI